ncbi:MAG: hypothetical protein PF518_13785 [Spirochaetaceae bacterium]|jgi:hypothetical protein|nr:hypothetical protein [Spirochaetaceae bacterium]
MVKRLIRVLLFLAAVPFVNAENIISVDMELYNTFMRTREVDYTAPLPPDVGDSYWAYGIAGKAGLSFKSAGKSNVRAELAVDFNYPHLSGIPRITLQKAYVKAKFPSFRLTVGKNRLGWGDGFVFNSGDVVFGSTSPNLSLIGSELRTETAWLTSVNFPLGRFSFIEGLVKAPDMILSAGKPVGLGKAEDLGAGLRLYAKLAGIKVETGYYFDGADLDDYDINHTSATGDEIQISGLHRPYFSLQGNFGPDFYINSSLSIPGADGNNQAAVVKDTFSISFGLFHVQEVGYDNSISFRVESVILPFLNWKESDGEAGSYAMLIYPEIALALGQTISISIRSIISPIDLSAQFTTGFSWNVFQGFNLLAYATVNAGDGDDTFSWSKTVWTPGVDVIDGISVMAGINYIY